MRKKKTEVQKKQDIQLRERTDKEKRPLKIDERTTIMVDAHLTNEEALAKYKEKLKRYAHKESFTDFVKTKGQVKGGGIK